MLREFNAEQLIRLIDKLQIKLDAIFQSGLLTVRNKSKGKGYNASFPDFVKCLIEGSKNPMAGTVDVDLRTPAVYQLWASACEVINEVNRVCRPFLEKFGVVEGNGLSPFAVEMKRPEDLLALLTEFCNKPPRRDSRDTVTHADGSVDNVVAEEECNENAGEDGGMEGGDGSETKEIPSDVMAKMIEELESEDDGNNNEAGDDNESCSVCVTEIISEEKEISFASGDSSKAFDEFNAMLKPDCTNEQIGIHALNIMQLMQLGSIDKGSKSMELKYKSLSARWFGCKAKKAGGNGDKCPENSSDSNDYISRDSLVTINVTRGTCTSLEHYRVLALYSKHYNKWYLHWDDDKVLFERESKKFKVLGQMVVKDGSSWKEVKLEKDGKWGPKSVFSIKSMSDVISVEGELTSGVNFYFN
jgi:hypothetical protein